MCNVEWNKSLDRIKWQSFSYHINLVSAQQALLHLFLRTIEEQDKLRFNLSLQKSSKACNYQNGITEKEMHRYLLSNFNILTTFSNAARFSSLRGKPSIRNLSFPFSCIAFCKSLIVTSDGTIFPSLIIFWIIVLQNHWTASFNTITKNLKNDNESEGDDSSSF